MKKFRQNQSGLLSNSRWLAYAAAGGDIEAHNLPLSSRVVLRFVRATGGSYYVAGGGGIFGGRVSNAVRGTFLNLSRLASGENVSTGRFYDVGSGGTRIMFWIYNSGNFGDPGEGFVGFKFDNGNGTQYGWARLEMGKYPRHNFEIVDFAWADPGESSTLSNVAAHPWPTPSRSSNNFT